MYISKEKRKQLKEIFQKLKESEKDSILGDDETPVQENDITVEVDGEVVTDTSTVEEEPTMETSVDEYGPKLAITDMLLQAVNDENTTIQYYNNLIAACNQEGFTDIANIIKHINEEENIHVGMLQHAISTISEQAKDIEKGVEEAEQIIAGEEPVEE